MAQSVENAYDALPYMSMAFPQTHPDRLAVIARLFGMTTAPLARCRVLELGCASGGNLIPMALDLPEASFLGIDLSGRQIADGKATIAKAGLSNVELRQMDIMDVDKSLGTFDYIIAHGVFSWVPTHVQEQMFRVCAQNLAPNGVAYVSYNTYPGWHMRGMIRDMMRYHVKSFPDATVRVQQARALLDFLAQSVPTENNAYGIVLKAELEMLRKQNDSYLAHEHLEDVNSPVYFHEFAERALARGLQFLGEAEFSTMLASNLPQQVSETLAQDRAGHRPDGAVHGFRAQSPVPPDVAGSPGHDAEPEPGLEDDAGLPDRFQGQAGVRDTGHRHQREGRVSPSVGDGRGDRRSHRQGRVHDPERE